MQATELRYEPTAKDWKEFRMDQQEYEQREWEVACRCGRKVKATAQVLEATGWQLGKYETCGVCVGYMKGATEALKFKAAGRA